MDDIVKQALVKWPNVPHCWGWLGLDARGQWWLRDDAVQALGPFPQAKGSRVEHAKLQAFIARNYEADDQGCWYFQNGPQRVYVELECAPQVWRVDADGQLHSALDGARGTADRWYADQAGRVYAADANGVLGVVHSQDMVHIATLLEVGALTVEEVAGDALPQQYGFVCSPLQARMQSVG